MIFVLANHNLGTWCRKWTHLWLWDRSFINKGQSCSRLGSFPINKTPPALSS